MVLISSAPQATNSAAIEISVPLRGLWFLSTLMLANEILKVLLPSPCGDYGSYQLNTNREKPLFPLRKLPSPCGDYGSYLGGLIYE